MKCTPCLSLAGRSMPTPARIKRSKHSEILQGNYFTRGLLQMIQIMSHKILAHCTELIRDCNDGYGLKEYSEEAVEACNKLIRRYREHLSRKYSVSLNIRDVFVRILGQSDPLFSSFFFATLWRDGSH